MKLLDASIEEAGQMDIMMVLARHFGAYCDFKDIRDADGRAEAIRRP
jgi:hypothetical protein